MATYNQPVIPEPFSWYQGNFGTDEREIVKTEREAGAGVFTTLKTAILNLGPDLATELGYVEEMLAHPIKTGEILLKAAAGYAQKGLPDAWEAYLPSDWAENKMYAEAINQHYIERYGSLEGAADAFAEKPVSVLLDVFIVKGILTAAARQAKRLTVVANNTLNSAKGTVLEGEIATRAAALNRASNEVKAANERVIIDKGVLVFDEATGVYVPVSSVGESAQAIKAAEASGGSVIIGGEVVHIPKPAPVVAESVAAAEVGARVSQADIIKLAENVKAAKQNVRTVKEKWDAVEGDTAIEAFYQKSVKPAEVEVIKAEIAVDTAIRNNAIADGNTALAASVERTLRDRNIKRIATEQDILYAEAAGIYNNSLTLEELAAQAEIFPVASAAKQAEMIANGQPAEVVAAIQQTAAEIQAALEARIAISKSAEALKTAEVVGTTYPIMNQAQRASVEARLNEGMITGTKAIDDAVKAEASALSAEASAVSANTLDAVKLADDAAKARDVAQGVSSTYPGAYTGILDGNFALDGRLMGGSVAERLAVVTEHINNVNTAIKLKPYSEEALLRAERVLAMFEITKSNLSKALSTEAAAKAAEATRYGLARKEAGDMYPNVAAQTGMITQAADLSVLPNFSRLAKTAEIDDLARISKIAEIAKAAETVKAGELATVGKGGELATVGKAGELAKAAEIAASIKSKAFPTKTVASLIKASETAANLDATTALNLQGQRGADGSFYPADIHPDIPTIKPPVVETETIPAIKSTSRPGWMQGNTHAPNDGNWWSADFDDEHWNTPAGVQEAINIWGRPMGSRHSWETPLGTKSQYTNRQQPDWSWMNDY